ncbi:MAG: hypothetical protein QNJ33_08430 [Crocosphaera sp.]|nr:hypothetical protein [Crocosphaera sp.]
MFQLFLTSFLLLPLNFHNQLSNYRLMSHEKLIENNRIMAQNSEKNKQFNHLKQELEKAGFEVIIALPPKRGAYGLLQVSTKKIWINPVVFDLHIALPTIIHESVHASQVCAGKGEIRALGLTLEPINQARPFFQGYTDIHRKDLEREAYTVQTQPNSFELALSLLKEHCQIIN